MGPVARTYRQGQMAVGATSNLAWEYGAGRHPPMIQRKTPLRRSPMKRKAPTMGETKKTSRRVVTPQKRADQVFSRYIRASRGRCQDDRPEHVCAGPLQTAHGHERGHLRTRYDERNVWSLCLGAHFYYGMHPTIWDAFMRRHQGDAHEEIRLLALRAEPIRLDYEEIAAQYRAKLAEVKEGAE